MEILEKNDIVVEIDKKVAVSFTKKYKHFTDVNGDKRSLGLKEVKKDITDYLYYNRNRFEGQKVFSFVYDYDANIAVTAMKRLPECEVYAIIGFSDMTAPEETFEDDDEKQATKEQVKILEQNEKIEKARIEQYKNAQKLQNIIEGLDG